MNHKPMADHLTILIADDHPIFRRGLREVIETDGGLTIVGEAENGVAALGMVEELRPQVAVLDIDMPRMNGFELVQELRRQNLEVAVVFLSMHKDEAMFNEAMALGVRGYVLKDSAATDLTAGIHAVAAGRHFISPALSTYLVNRSERLSAFAQEKPGLSALTPAERRVLKLIAENKTSREISAELFVSHRTIENHRSNICQKLGLQGSHSLIKFAIEHKSQLS
jgi:DNA-binding NarL/FixJ family response regulator